MTLSDVKNTHILFRTASHNLYLNYPDRNEVKSVGDCMHFHVNDTIGRDAYQASLFVAAHIVETAFTKQWTTPFSKSTDEKYLFRTWLHGIGISEKQYPAVWQILMRNYLSDKTDFYGVRTDE